MVDEMLIGGFFLSVKVHPPLCKRGVRRDLCVKVFFQLIKGCQIGRLAAEGRHQLAGRAHVFERVQREDFNVFDIFYAGVGVFFQQRLQYLARLLAVFGKLVAFFYLVSTLAAG